MLSCAFFLSSMHILCLISVDTSYSVSYINDSVKSKLIITTSESPSQDDGKEAIHPDDGLRLLARIVAHHLSVKRSPRNRKSDIASNDHQVSWDKSDESVP